MAALRPCALLVLLAALGAACVSGGCSYVNLPEWDENDAAVNDPNAPPAPAVAGLAAEWIARRYPVDGPFVVNLPRGMGYESAQTALQLMKNPDARLPTPSTADLPRYHIEKIIIRADFASVDVLRPVYGLTINGTESRYQRFTLRMKGGLQQWHVVSWRAWTIGIPEEPELFGWPDDVPTNLTPSRTEPLSRRP